jgi:hypothetical protein
LACWLASAPCRSSSLQPKRFAAGLIVSLLVVFWVPMLLWGDIDFGMKMVTFAQPFNEFEGLAWMLVCSDQGDRGPGHPMVLSQ